MEFWSSFWNIIWVFFSAVIFIAYLIALFSIVADLFSDRKLSGWWKAIWLFALVLIPFVTSLIYLIARGQGMAERKFHTVAENQSAAEDYIRSVAQASPSDEIAKAKQLFDAGVLTADEFQAIKNHALGSVKVPVA
ncbi:hypothetical protein CVS30_12620 [Arthrobacter psychrolactophilus]|uniref:SHOCT domain-containing protein n=1 Tax=Arthrobacter psychrolactophilus TaxID=92442 RepID=A0A2V5INA9_9MICC|nr:SHOCT domain-containing protein [Arthrobacter psychrolactophilus]PYI38069.1 hypothetical protein CVS30_12620 [Arthrobacter psychrolactophilus]